MASTIRGGARRLASGRWQARYTDPRRSGRSITAPTTFRTKGAALAWLENERRLFDLDPDGWLPPRERDEIEKKKQAARRTTVADCLTEWLVEKESELRTSTFQKYEEVLRHRVLEATGEAAELHAMPIGDVTTADIAAWWKAVASTYPTASTNKKAYGYLKSAFARAVERGVIATNPASLTRSTLKYAGGSSASDTPPWLAPAADDLETVVRDGPVRLKLAFALCLIHGLRIGEVLALEIKDVVKVFAGAEIRYSIRVSKNIQRVRGDDGRYMMERQPSKTPSAVRCVPVLASYTTLVEEHLAAISEMNNPSGLLFPARDGGYRMDTSVRETMKRTAARNGIDGIHPHIGRKFLITSLAELGASPAEIGSITGQKDRRTITDVYMRVRQERPEVLMQRLDQAL